MATIKVVSRYYIRSDGTFYPASTSTAFFYPNSNYSNLLEIMMEDGSTGSSFVQVNFLLNGKYVTEWLPLFKGGVEAVEDEESGVNISYTKFSILVPNQVLQNASPTATKPIDISVRLVYGEGWYGTYDTYTDLETDLPPTEALSLEYATAFVLEDEGENEDGYYQVQYDSDEEDYFWTAVSIVNLYQEVKGYGVGTATLQKGFVNPKGTVTISNATQHLIYIELASLEARIETLETEVEALDLDKLEKDFGLYDPKTTYNDGDSIAINDDEDTGNPKEMALSDLMKAENVSFDNSGSVGLEADNVKEAIEELESDIIAVDEKVDLHIEDETNPHNTTASLTPFTPTTNISSEFVQEAIEEVRELLDDFPLDNIFVFDTTAGTLEYVLYVIQRDAPTRCVFHGIRDGNYIFGTSLNEGGGQLKVTLISPTDVQVLEYDATSGALGTITSEQSISGIFDGTEIVKKAEQDASGNVITTTYATKTERSDGDFLKVDKNLASYSTATLAGTQVMYVQDGASYKKATLSALRTFIANDFVSFGYVIASDDGTGLPDVAEPLTNKIYLVATGDSEEDNVYNEFIYAEGEWELFGTTALDLTDYTKKTNAEVTSLANVGMITAEDTVSIGTTLQQFIEQLLVGTYTTQYPSLIAPSATVVTDQVTNIETGTIVDVELTASFNRGQILGDGEGTEWNDSVEQNKRAGVVTSYELGVDGAEVDNGTDPVYTVSDFEIADGNNVFSVIVNHEAGEQPLDSDGENYDSPLSAGTVEDTVTLKGVRKLFYGYSNDAVDSDDIRALQFSTLNPQNGTSFIINVPIGATNVVFAYPSTLREVLSVTQQGVGDAKSQFVESEIDVESAKAGVAGEVAYRVYVFTPAEAYLTEESYGVVI